MQEIRFIKTLISRICHDLINPIGAMKMIMDEMQNTSQNVDDSLSQHDMSNYELLSDSINHAMQTLDMLRHALNDNLSITNVEKLIMQNTENLSLKSDNITNINFRIVMLLALALKQKSNKYQIQLIENQIKLHIRLSEDELNALNQSTESSYTIYFNFISKLLGSDNISYVDDLLTLTT